MDKIIKRMSERLADQSSRRGFISKMGKAAFGAVAIITGQGIFTQVAEAATPLRCCTAGSSGACAHWNCPQGSRITYTWHCGHPAGGGYYICHDCYSWSTNRLVCVFATYQP